MKDAKTVEKMEVTKVTTKVEVRFEKEFKTDVPVPYGNGKTFEFEKGFTFTPDQFNKFDDEDGTAVYAGPMYRVEVPAEYVKAYVVETVCYREVFEYPYQPEKN